MFRKVGVFATHFAKPYFVKSGRLLHRSPLAMVSQKFEQAKQKINTLNIDPGNDTKLKLYALYKQATVGQCNTPKPGMMDFVAKAKWQAWSSLQSLPKDDAEQQYINLVEQLAAAGGTTEEEEGAAGTQTDKYPGLLVSSQGGITLVTLNRPRKMNSLTPEMYSGITEILTQSGKDPTCKAVAITGSGDYYCSGNDLSNFTKMASMGDIPTMSAKAAELLKTYVGAYIDFPKPLIVGVNGPAIGISVTVLGLCDIVLASDQTTFHTPFSSLGQAPEGCSTLTFPRLMGSKANKMLMLNYKMPAVEAEACGLVTELLPHSNFPEEFRRRLEQISQLPAESLRCAKRPLRDVERELLHRINAAECLQLVERWQSEDCMAALAKFFQRNKL